MDAAISVITSRDHRLTPDSDTNWSTNCHLRGSAEDLPKTERGNLRFLVTAVSNTYLFYAMYGDKCLLPLYRDHAHICKHTK